VNKQLDSEGKQLESVALKLLARREHSRKELQQKLEKKGFASKQVAFVLQQLIKKGWQSDDRFADCYIRSRIHAGFGPRRILFELNQRGVHSTLAEKYLKSDDNQFWVKQIKRIYVKRFAAIPNNQAIDAKHYRFLQQRGFMHDTIMQLLKGNDNEYS
jgi:regulatory protein